jgi:hypothetical protein
MAAMGGARRRRASGRGPVLGGMIRGPQRERNTALWAQRWHHPCGLSSSPSTDLRPPGSVTAIMGARPQGLAAQREARDSAGVFRHNTWAGDTPGSIAWTL